MIDELTQQAELVLADIERVRPQIEAVPKKRALPDRLLRDAMDLTRRLDHVAERVAEYGDAEAIALTGRLRTAQVWFRHNGIPSSYKGQAPA